ELDQPVAIERAAALATKHVEAVPPYRRVEVEAGGPGRGMPRGGTGRPPRPDDECRIARSHELHGRGGIRLTRQERPATVPEHLAAEAWTPVARRRRGELGCGRGHPPSIAAQEHAWTWIAQKKLRNRPDSSCRVGDLCPRSEARHPTITRSEQF